MSIIRQTEELRKDRMFEDVGESFYKQYRTKEANFYDDYVDIYDFFEVLMNVLRAKSLLIEDSKEVKELSKIKIVEEYPDELYNENDVVVYSIGQRSYNAQSSVGVPKPIIQRQARLLNSSSDIISGNIIQDYSHIYHNTISFEVFSRSSRRLMEICRFLEAFMIKYKGDLKRYVDEIVYVGQSATTYNSRYSEKKLLSRSIIFNVITYSRYSLATEEMKIIR